jgi:NDP-sugar pyrophosphorylase family protein
MKAMVLCAGYGTRLGDLTRRMPKPMLPLGERPILEYILRNLVRCGFDQIAINLHFMPEMIRDHFGTGNRHAASLVYSHEPKLLGTAGGLKKMASFFERGGAFLVHYGDVVTNQDFAAMLDCHRRRRALATLLIHQRAGSNSVVSLDEDCRIVGFLERPTEQERGGVPSTWAFSGVMICEPELLDAIPPGVACDLPRDVFPKFVPTGRLVGFPLTGYRCAIDSPRRLAEARAAVESEVLR